MQIFDAHHMLALLTILSEYSPHIYTYNIYIRIYIYTVLYLIWGWRSYKCASNQHCVSLFCEWSVCQCVFKWMQPFNRENILWARANQQKKLPMRTWNHCTRLNGSRVLTVCYFGDGLVEDQWFATGRPMASEIRSELRQADSYSAVQHLDTMWTGKQANKTW